MTEEVGINDQLIHPPKSSRNNVNTQLAYVSSYDGVTNKDYAFVVYKEENIKKGEYKIKVKSKQTADTSIDPGHPIFRRKMSEALKNGSDYFVMGFGMTPREGDPRLVESRIYFNDLMIPECYQLNLITRNVDGTPAEEKCIRIAWPD